MGDLERYQQLKRTVDRLRRDADRMEGALAQTTVRLEEEFGCETLEQAETLAAALSREADAAEREFGRAFGVFVEEWGDELEGELR